MKATVETLISLSSNNFAVFTNGKLHWVHAVNAESKVVIMGNGDRMSYEAFCKSAEANCMKIFALSDIKMPTDQSSALIEKLSQIEVKSKTCQMWFDELGAGQLKEAINACKDETFINDKAISLIDAIELSCFLEVGVPDSDYLRRVIQDNKNK